MQLRPTLGEVIEAEGIDPRERCCGLDLGERLRLPLKPGINSSAIMHSTMISAMRR